MNERIGMIIFMTVFVAIYGLLNFYVLHRFWTMFQLRKGIIFFSVLILASISYIIASILESSYGILPTKALYMIAAIWMGTAFIAACIHVIVHLANIFIPIANKMTGSIIIVITLVLTIIALMSANSIGIKTVPIATEKVHESYTVVQISDTHFGPLYGTGTARQIVDKIIEQDPDVVLMTGDLIDGKFIFDEKTFTEFNRISVPIYIVQGNHERYASFEVFSKVLKLTPMQLLQSKTVQYKELKIIGIDDSDNKKQLLQTLPTVQKDFDESTFNILMYHRPTGYKDAAKFKLNLLLSGHTHAGQIWPFSYLAQLENDGALKGTYTVPGKDFLLYVNPGTGTWGPPMRLGSRSEITVFKISPK